MLGLIAVALGTALSLVLTLHLIWLMPFHMGVIVVAVCIALGLVLSVLALVGRRGYYAHALSGVKQQKCLAHVLRLISEVVQTKKGRGRTPIGVQGMASASV